MQKKPTKPKESKIEKPITLEQFFMNWRYTFSVRHFEDRCGIKRNEIAHAMSKERRPIPYFSQPMIKGVLKQMQRDLNKLDLNR